MLYYYAMAMKYERLSREQSNPSLHPGQKVFINQRLEVIDGTFDVWIFLREAIVDWLFEIFIRSADRAAQRKMSLWFYLGIHMFSSNVTWKI